MFCRLWVGHLGDGHLWVLCHGPASPLLCGSRLNLSALCFPSLPSSYMLGEGFLWGVSMSISTDSWEAEKGLCSEWGPELKPWRLLPSSCSTIDDGDAPFSLPISLAKRCCENKYLEDCEALRRDGCRGLRDLTSCKCGYSLLMGLISSAKCKKPCLHTMRPQFHLQLSAWEYLRGRVDVGFRLQCSGMRVAPIAWCHTWAKYQIFSITLFPSGQVRWLNL